MTTCISLGVPKDVIYGHNIMHTSCGLGVVIPCQGQSGVKMSFLGFFRIGAMLFACSKLGGLPFPLLKHTVEG